MLIYHRAVMPFAARDPMLLPNSLVNNNRAKHPRFTAASNMGLHLLNTPLPFTSTLADERGKKTSHPYKTMWCDFTTNTTTL